VLVSRSLSRHFPPLGYVPEGDPWDDRVCSEQFFVGREVTSNGNQMISIRGPGKGEGEERGKGKGKNESKKEGIL
jgi:hypothetical protein